MGLYQTQKKTLKDKTEVSIRNAEESDKHSLIHFMKEIFETSEFLATKPEEFNLTIDQESSFITECKNLPQNLLLLSFFKNELVGLVDLAGGSKERRKHSGELDIFIKKDFRGKGLGKILLQETLHWAKTQSPLKRIGLSVFSTHEVGLSLYKKMGFFEEGKKLKSVFTDKQGYIDEILMVYFLE
jgi:RimJ/RimL family protein N-acetyltransferase